MSGNTDMDPIYLDHNATTPVDPEVLEAMLPYLRGEYGNPSSAHPLGRRAKRAVEKAREEVAALIHARLPEEIVFTSGGTEAIQLGILGAAEARRERAGGARPLRIVSFALEHPASMRPLEGLRRRGDDAVLIPPDADGLVQIGPFLDGLEGPPPADLAILMLAHNETGAIQPVSRAGDACRRSGTILQVDAAQAIGKIPVDVEAIGCDLLAMAGHKFYAPKGIGALYVRKGTALVPLTPGAGQEDGRRGGTQNVPGIVGLGKAAEIAGRRLAEGEGERLRGLRERLMDGLRAEIPGLARTAAGAETLPNTLHVRFPRVRGNAMLEATPGIAASTGSACHSGIDRAPEPIVALGVSEEDALGSVRLSLGHSIDRDAIDLAIERLVRGWRTLTGGNRHVPGR